MTKFRTTALASTAAGAMLVGLSLASVAATGAVVASNVALAYTPAKPEVLFVGRGVAVVAAFDTHGCAHVLLSRDLGHWRSIAAALPKPPHECGYAWTSASFVSPLDGWLLGRNPAGTTTVLVHTLDGRHGRCNLGGQPGVMAVKR